MSTRDRPPIGFAGLVRVREYHMPSTEKLKAPNYHIPTVTCPRCSKTMRLARAEPVHDKEARLIFDCECGFEYRMSERARGET